MLAYIKNVLNNNGFAKVLKNLLKSVNSKFNYTLSVKIRDKKFSIPIINNIGFSNITLNDGLWITEVFKLLLSKKKGEFIDIGANVGQTLLELRSVNGNVGYYGFEPNSACAFYVRNLIKKNKFINSFIIPAGIFKSNSLVNFDLVSDADLGGTLVENLRPGTTLNERIIVPVYNFDSIVENLHIEKISLVKIDVEGAELDVLSSLKVTLGKFRPFVICEILWAHNEEKLDSCAKRNKDILELVSNSDYKIFRIIKDDSLNAISSLLEIKEIENLVYTPENRELCDYLLVPKEDIDRISDIYKLN